MFHNEQFLCSLSFVPGVGQFSHLCFHVLQWCSGSCQLQFIVKQNSAEMKGSFLGLSCYRITEGSIWIHVHIHVSYYWMTSHFALCYTSFTPHSQEVWKWLIASYQLETKKCTNGHTSRFVNLTFWTWFSIWGKLLQAQRCQTKLTLFNLGMLLVCTQGVKKLLNYMNEVKNTYQRKLVFFFLLRRVYMYKCTSNHICVKLFVLLLSSVYLKGKVKSALSHAAH